MSQTQDLYYVFITSKKIICKRSILMEIPGQISLLKLIFSIQELIHIPELILILGSIMIPLSGQIAIPRSIPISEPIAEWIPEPTRESAPKSTPESTPETTPE